MQKQVIEKLSERDHILRRPAMYISGVTSAESFQWVYGDAGIEYKNVTYVPGLIKIINEIIDNSIDEYIKTSGKFANKISVYVEDTRIIVQDNGRGIPVEKNGEFYTPALCWTHARAGSNFDDDNNQAQIGTNGVGSFATAVFSKKFVGETDDGKKSYKIVVTENAGKIKETVYDETKNRGTKVTFEPDLVRFGVDKVDDIHKSIIRTRLLNLAATYPDIDIKYNGRKISIRNKKEFIKLFGESFELIESENYFFAVYPNPEDDFRQFSYINGLNISVGGTHIDLISSSITSRVRDNLIKKYKSIKPADIRNKLLIVFMGKNFKNLKFDSQTKEKITNSAAETTEYLGSVDWDLLARKILRNKAIIDPITEVYRIKEEFKRRQELQNLNKVTKKIKSDKYLPSIGDKKYLLLVEGDSALGGLMPVLGRKECGYFTLRGKPLNAYSAASSKFTDNKELSDLYKILKHETQIVDKEDGDWFELEVDGIKYIVNENDSIEINGKNVNIKSLIS